MKSVRTKVLDSNQYKTNGEIDIISIEIVNLVYKGIGNPLDILEGQVKYNTLVQVDPHEWFVKSVQDSILALEHHFYGGEVKKSPKVIDLFGDEIQTPVASVVDEQIRFSILEKMNIDEITSP